MSVEDQVGRLTSQGAWEVISVTGSTLSNNHLAALSFDDSGALWAGTLWGGVARLGFDGTWQVFDNINSDLPYRGAISLCSDESGGMWMGTISGGMAHLMSNGIWQVFDTDNSDLPHDAVRSLFPDGLGGVWAATDAGLAHLMTDNSWQVYDTANSDLTADQVLCLEPDGSDGLWAGTSDGLARLMADSSWQVFDTGNSGLPYTDIHDLARDGSGGLWVAVGALARLLADGAWQVFNTDNSGLPADTVATVSPDGAGGVWAGTQTGGLARMLADGTWQAFDTANSGLPGISVETLLADGSGGVWAGTESDGLAHLAFGVKQAAAEKIDDETMREKLFTDKRAAILIHARAAENQESKVQSMAAHIYQTLQARGFDHDEICFLSHIPLMDINNDGFADSNGVDGPVTALEAAAGATSRNITLVDVWNALDWARGKGQLDQPLIFIFLGAGSQDRLFLDPAGNSVTDSILDFMLDNYQTATGNQVVVILEAACSGALADDLAGVDRVVVTSTSNGPAFYQDRGRIGFSHELFNALGTGNTLKDAFDLASGRLAGFGSPFNGQIPCLNQADGQVAETFCLNGCWGPLSQDIAFLPQTQPGPVGQGETKNLSVKVTARDSAIQRVWATIVTPEAALLRDETGFSRTPAPKLRLAQGQGGVWSGDFSGFHHRGEYRVFFMAKDGEGLVHAASPVVLTAANGPAVPGTNPYDQGDSPAAGQSTYLPGDRLLVTLPDLPFGKDQYAAIDPEEGGLFFLTGPNSFVAYDGETFVPWAGETIAFDLIVSDEFFKGKCTVYLLRVPAGVNPAGNTDEWEVGWVTFEIK